VGSFRGSVILWLDQSFSGDIEIIGENIPAELQLQLEQLDGIASVNGIITKTVESEFEELRLQSKSLPAEQSYYFKELSEENLRRFNAGQGVLLSEPFAWRHQLEIGNSISLFTDRGSSSFVVLGIIYDYAPGLGLVAMDQDLYRNWWGDAEFSRLRISTEENINPDDLLPQLREILDQYPQALVIVPNETIRDLTLAIFDRTFTITGVLRILAIVVAFIGVLSALMALLLERLREFGILRASGMTPHQIILLILGQAAVMGIFAGLLSLPLGLMMSDVLIDVINQRSFGWSMQRFLPVSVLFEAFILAVLAAVLAAVYPAIRASQVSPALALREE